VLFVGALGLFAVAKLLAARETVEHRFLATLAVTAAEAHPETAAISRAESAVSRLANDRDTEGLQARLALLRHDDARAFEAALASRSMPIIDELIDASARHGQVVRAIARCERVIATVRNQPTERELAAETYWRLGILENLAATHANPYPHRLRARDAFEQSVALTPFSGRALLSAAYAEFALGNLTRAHERFTEALAADPSDADAVKGLARVALRLHHP
jgi:tetratricopeptide (TPR) repeat protein